MHTRLALALGLLVGGSVVLIGTMSLSPAPQITQPAAHAAFLAWAREHGYVGDSGQLPGNCQLSLHPC